MKTVMVFGTFDKLHAGHLNFFKQARHFGDKLIVVVARDKTVKQIKHNLPSQNENQRLEIIKQCGFADTAVLGNLGDKYRIIQDIKPDVICLGYDQNSFSDNLKEKLNSLNLGSIKIHRLKPYKENIYKTSKLRENNKKTKERKTQKHSFHSKHENIETK